MVRPAEHDARDGQASGNESMMVRPEPGRVVERISEMVGSPWPTSEHERQSWFAQLGLPVDGAPVADQDGRVPRAVQFIGPPSEDWPETGWHLHRGQFVGVHWFLWAGEDEDATRAAAESLRTQLSARWPAIDELLSPTGGFTTLWHPADSRIDLYYHAPRNDLGPPAMPGVVQLHVDHRARADAAEAEALIGDVLVQHWVPDAVLDTTWAAEVNDTWVGRLVDSLRAGGGRTEILAELRRARHRIGLPDGSDENAADLIISRWRTRPGG